MIWGLTLGRFVRNAWTYAFSTFIRQTVPHGPNGLIATTEEHCGGALALWRETGPQGTTTHIKGYVLDVGGELLAIRF